VGRRLEETHRKLRPYLLATPSLLFVTLFMIVPIIYMVVFTSDFAYTFAKTVHDVEFASVFLRTMRVGVVVALLATLMGYPLAYYVSSSSPSVKSFFKTVVFIPLMVNPLVRSYGWIIILGREGLLNSVMTSLKLLDEPVRILYTELAMELGLLELFFPFMFVPLLSAMENLSEETLMAARSLGAGPVRTFVNIVFPLTMRGYVVGLSVILAGCAAAFVTPTLLGGFRNRTLSMLLYEYIEVRLDWGAAGATALIIMLTVFSVNVLLTYLGRMAVKGR
jgi:putative spermidine/putrescine transport system permease protein